MKLEFHHINFVSENVDRLHDFYTQVRVLMTSLSSRFQDLMRQTQVAMTGR